MDYHNCYKIYDRVTVVTMVILSLKRKHTRVIKLLYILYWQLKFISKLFRFVYILPSSKILLDTGPFTGA